MNLSSKKSNLSIFALSIFLLFSNFNRLYSAEYITNTDSGVANRSLLNGDVVAGTHTNLGLFTIPANAVVSVQANTAPNYGFFMVEAGTITIDGKLNDDAAGPVELH